MSIGEASGEDIGRVLAEGGILASAAHAGSSLLMIDEGIVSEEASSLGMAVLLLADTVSEMVSLLEIFISSSIAIDDDDVGNCCCSCSSQTCCTFFDGDWLLATIFNFVKVLQRDNFNNSGCKPIQ